MVKILSSNGEMITMKPKYIQKQVLFLLKHTTYNQSEKGVKVKNIMQLINRMHWRFIDEIFDPNEITSAIAKDKHFSVQGKYIKVIK